MRSRELNVLSVTFSNVLWLTMYRQCTDLKLCNYKVGCMGTISVEAIEDTIMRVMSENQRKWYCTWMATKKTECEINRCVVYTSKRTQTWNARKAHWYSHQFYRFVRAAKSTVSVNLMINWRRREEEWTKIL